MHPPLEQALQTAHEAVVAAKLPEAWQVKAFEVSLAYLLTGDTSDRGAKAPVSPPARGEAGGVDRLGISSADLDDLADWDVATGVLRLTVPSSKLPSTKSDATRVVSLLVTSARLALGLDTESVDSTHVRTTLEDYGRYDLSNFSAHVKKFEEDVVVSKKDGRTEFKLRRQGWEHAADEWRSLATSERAK